MILRSFIHKLLRGRYIYLLLYYAYPYYRTRQETKTTIYYCRRRGVSVYIYVSIFEFILSSHPAKIRITAPLAPTRRNSAYRRP